ncbi:hypothetical protein VOLCADRAFT_93202 [Volvox carteri f. nagariensis]|uniref:Uncharacterized protein n=1 Tax=Volvox carteri f. nagariensis TaxID=3068 RepID=D8U1K0_VOLCA|nr:uncharacterized protein VOLCADRAFT_93202 [Volvox carteri f. nagariensis]EFJ46425.1 hypothetical protein VOLCADRAFT_93202 [Volvox carteri f. nagariensis]|eukprot:XP_002952578.1 hypothetical protein VOLCADRAFT_93202 [Volvox carteri f. nagariensis]
MIGRMVLGLLLLPACAMQQLQCDEHVAHFDGIGWAASALFGFYGSRGARRKRCASVTAGVRQVAACMYIIYVYFCLERPVRGEVVIMRALTAARLAPWPIERMAWVLYLRYNPCTSPPPRSSGRTIRNTQSPIPNIQLRAPLPASPKVLSEGKEHRGEQACEHKTQNIADNR